MSWPTPWALTRGRFKVKAAIYLILPTILLALAALTATASQTALW